LLLVRHKAKVVEEEMLALGSQLGWHWAQQ